ncbi:uncharacterized protein [Chironomus tepperi]|uniref:uncharacterized protein n=1 Tax=Chironomus tepperi TaxID=113505 RepID=UPI00391EF1C0
MYSSPPESLPFPCPPPPPTISQSKPKITLESLNPAEFPLKDVEGITVKNCANVKNALEVLEQRWLINKFKQQHSAFLINFEITNDLDDADSTKIVKIFEKFNKPFSMILFKGTERSEIFWKFRNEQIFSINFEPEILKFLLTFLTQSMKVDIHSGISLDTLIILNSSDDICRLNLYALADPRDYNLLMLAADHGDINAVNYLFRQGFDLNILVANKTAIDLAWENEHFDIVLLLLNANSVYPSKFNDKKATKELKEFASQAQQLHNSIKNENIDEIKDILSQSPNLRHFYTSDNTSAAAEAANCDDLEIYDLLMSNNVFIGPKEDVNKIFKNFNSAHREDMRGINLKYVKNWTEKHLMILIVNSFVGHDIPDVDEKLEYVTKAFEFLDKTHPFVSLILKVVAASRDFKIIFDIKRDSVQYLNPTADQHTRGVFHTSRHIYIAAQHFFDSEKKLEAYGTLIHELCHYACHLVYHNQCRPYCSTNDEKIIERFSAVTSKCQLRAHNEDLIDMVFKYYPKNLHHAELIVRVPHMIVKYSNDDKKLKENQTLFSELFKFTEEVTADYMEKSLPNIEIKAEEEILKFADRTKKQKRQIYRLWIFSAFLTVSIPFLIWLTWRLAFNPIEPIYSCANLTDELRPKIFNSIVDFQGEHVIFGDLFGRNLTSCESLSTDEIRNMLKVYDSNEMNKSLNKATTVSYFNQYDYNGQYDYDSVETLDQGDYNGSVVAGLKIGHKVQQKSKIYIDRTFMHVFMHNNEYNYPEKAFDDIKHDKLLLLSDGPGNGKSTTFRRMALKFKENYPLHWVSYIDLKLHFEAFKELNSYLGSNIDQVSFTQELTQFLSQKILNLTSKVDMEVFRHKFTSNQSIFLWDGLDEISPYSLNESLKLFELIYKFTSNIQWISTRPSFKQYIVDRFPVNEYRLAPYTEKSRNDFIRKYLKSEKMSHQNITIAKKKIGSFIKRLERQGSDDFYGREIISSPLMLNMICKSYSQSQSLDASTNLYTFFEFYINQMFDIVQQEKGDVVTNDTKRIERQEMFRDIHQHFAMKSLFPQDYKIKNIYDHHEVFDPNHLAIMKLRLAWKDDEISRYGILFPDPTGKLNFDHRTFMEFFVAQYFYDKIWNLGYGQVSRNEARLRISILLEIIETKSKFIYNVILDFIFGFIDAHTKDTSDSFNEEIRHVMEYDYKDLFQSVNTEIRNIDCYSTFFKKDQKILEILWKIDENLTSFHEFIFLGVFYSDLKDLTEVVAKYFNKDDQKKIFEGKYQNVNFLFIIWSNRQDKKFVKYFANVTNFSHQLESMEPTLNAIDYIEDFIEFIKSKNFSQPEYFEFLAANLQTITDNIHALTAGLDLAENKLSSTEIKTFLQQHMHNQTLLVTLNKQDVNAVKLFLSTIEKYLDKDEISSLLMLRNTRFMDTVLTPNLNDLEFSKSYEDIWIFVKKYLSLEQRKSMLTMNDDTSSLYVLYSGTQMESFLFYKMIFMETFSVNEIRNIMMTVDRYGETFIFEAIARGRSLEVLSAVANFIEEIFKGNDEELRKLLSFRSKYKVETIFMKYSNRESKLKAKLEPFEDLAKKVFTAVQLRALYD